MLINGEGGGYRLGGYREWPAPPALRAWVEVFWSYRAREAQRDIVAGTRHRVVPETGVSLFVTSRSGRRGAVEDLGLWLMGPIVRSRMFAPDLRVRLDGVRFKIEACRPLLGLHPADHADAIDELPVLSTARLRGAVRSLHAVRGQREIPHLLAVATGALVEARTPARAGAPAHALLERVRLRPHAPLRLAEQAAVLGASERHIRGLVRETTGRGPKYFHRVRRFQHVVSLGDSAWRPRWSMVAASAGYVDQAHLIREFRDLTGLTPSALHAERRAQQSGRGGHQQSHGADPTWARMAGFSNRCEVG